MKLAIKLAYRNLIGAGLRTWLNVIVLSFSFIMIIWMKGIVTGWDYQAKTDMTNWEIGGGQYWHENYDPYDPFTFQDSHAPIPSALTASIEAGDIEPSLVVQGSVFPQGRMQSINIRGIDPAQDIFLLPTHKLDTAINAVPAIIGTASSENFHLSEGDYVTIRWRDANGMFDATELLITGIFSCDVPAVDAGQVYIPLETLQNMMGLEGQATLLTLKNEDIQSPEMDG